MLSQELRSTSCWRIGLVATVIWMVLWFAACSSSDNERDRTFTIAFSNDMEGEIRSCGCPTKDYGGLGRQASFVSILRDTSRNFLLLEGGDFFGAGINYGKEKAEVTMKAMVLMGYHGVVLGENEFSFGLEYIKKRPVEIGLPVIVANLFDAEADTLLFPPVRKLELSGGLKVALIGVIGNHLQMPPQIKPDVIRITDPITAIRSEIESLGEDVDLIVVLAHMDRSEVAAITMELPRIDLVVIGHKGKPVRGTVRRGNAFILQVPREGRYMGYANCKLNSEKRIETLVSNMELLSTRYRDDEKVSKLFEAYDMNIKTKESAGIPTGLVTAGKELRKPFAGVEQCRECHEEIYNQWLETKHAHAFDILVEHSREFDRDCTPCHTTGFFKGGGFASLAATPELIHVQCEECHGNGYDHLQNQDIAPGEDASAVCTRCHNADQSPGFTFEAKWPMIQH